MSRYNGNLLGKVLDRGDSVAIEAGRLVFILKESGDFLSDQKLNPYKTQLLAEISQATGLAIYCYDSFTTGNYQGGKYPGVTLQFSSVNDANAYYTIFNAKLTRQRTTKTGKKGAPLPNKQFHVTKRHCFYKFWAGTGLPIPPRLTVFHDYMGNLKKLLFTAESAIGQRLESATLSPLNISTEQLRQAIGITDKLQTSAPQRTDNTPTALPHKESPVTLDNTGLQANRGTGDTKHVISNQVNAETRQAYSFSITPENLAKQSPDCWIDDYIDAPG